MWDGRAWSSLGSGVDNMVNALLVDEFGTLYVGGIFATAGGIAANGIAAWGQSGWAALDPSPDDSVYALAQDLSGSIIVGGSFLAVGYQSATYVARWTPSAIESLEPDAPRTESQAYAISSDENCVDNAPAWVNWPGLAGSQYLSWGKSWQQWPNGGTGGFVCVRQPVFITSGTWGTR
jgi:hypothetical protein